MVKAQIPLGELRTDNAGPMISFHIFLPTAAKALAVNAPTVTYHERGLSVSFPYFVKLLAEGNIVAHTALWTPYYEGELFPRADLLNDALVRNLETMEGSQYHRFLGWKHAQEIAYKREFVLEREDWEFLDRVKYSKKEMPELDRRLELPLLGTNPRVYDDLIERYY